MTRSLAEAVTLTCASCQQSFSTEIWLVVDREERPDLVARIHDESIHTTACLHCGMAHPLDAPLLLHDGPRKLLVFASQEQTTAARDQAIARELGQRLIANIAPDERDVYLTTAQTVVGVDGLRRALAGEPELERDELSHALTALMEATSPLQVRAAAEMHPILKTPDAQQQLRAYVQQLRESGHDDLVTALHARTEALEGAQPHPTLQFIQALLDANGPEARAALLQSRPQDITPEVPTILEALADQAQRRHLEPVARDLLVIRDEVLGKLGRDVPVTPTA